VAGESLLFNSCILESCGANASAWLSGSKGARARTPAALSQAARERMDRMELMFMMYTDFELWDMD
jgi:hypothetical protein